MPPPVRRAPPLRTAPPLAARSAASSPRCAPPQLPSLGHSHRSCAHVGLRRSEENELWGALSAPPDGSAPRMGWWGELGVALHAIGRLGRRVAQRRCVALRPARALSCRRRRREGWGGDRLSVGGEAWGGGGRRGDAASGPLRTSPANGAAPGGAQRRQQPALRAPSAPPLGRFRTHRGQPPCCRAVDAMLWALMRRSPTGSAAMVGSGGELGVQIYRSGHVERAWASSLGRSPSGVRAGRAGVVGGTGGGAVDILRVLRSPGQQEGLPVAWRVQSAGPVRSRAL